MTFDPHATAKQRVEALKQFIAELRADSSPILLGPWRSELGFEATYWTPFLAWLAKQVPNFDTRAAVITRGGLARLYKTVASQGYDLYALRSVTGIRRENLFDQKTTSLQKQIRITEWDEKVLADAAVALGLGLVYHTVHPAWMYWVLEPYWNESVGLQYLLGLTDYAPLPKPAKPHAPGLPEKYVAVKFYNRHTLHVLDPEVHTFIKQTVSVLASQTAVVLLNSASVYDDHSDVLCSGPNLFTLPELKPEENLLMQAALLAHATAFVGTYGGMAQLAMRFQIPSVSFWKDEFTGTASAHHYVNWWVSKQQHVPFLTGSIAETWLWSQCTNVPPAITTAPQVSEATA